MSSFYIGYLPRPPADLARFIRRVVTVVCALAALISCVLVLSQRRFEETFFEFGSVHDFEGVIERKPYPTLLVRRPGSTPAEQQYSRYLLVGVGKHGAGPGVSRFEGRYVTLKGKLIYRPGQTMVEVMPDSVRAMGTAMSPSAQAASGPIVSIRGEIVDSKCHTGVMNPGSGKVHRDCAVRCLSGGVPPILVESSEPHRAILLASADGGQLQPSTYLGEVGQPVLVKGRLVSRGNRIQLLVEHIDGPGT